MILFLISTHFCILGRGVNLIPIRWVNQIHPELGLGWAINLLAQKNGPNLARPARLDLGSGCYFFGHKKRG